MEGNRIEEYYQDFTVKEIHEIEMLNFSLRLTRNKAQKYWLKWLLYVNEKTE